MLVWIDAATCGRTPKVFGLTLVERHLQALKRSLPVPTRIVVDLGSDGKRPGIDPSLGNVLAIEWQQGAGTFSARLKAFLESVAGEPVLILDGGTLPDARLHAALAPLAESVAVLPDSDSERAAMIRIEAGAAGDVPNDCIGVRELAAHLLETGVVRPYRQDEFNGFIRKLRRTIPFYMFSVDTADKAARVERFMFWSNYKGSTDFFTRYVYPPLVWFSVGPLARARVHPNTVTILSIVLAIGAIPLWSVGYFWTGFAMAYGMSVLDSVDGKLARLTFTDSRVGNWLDHGLDMVHPPFWYLAWAYGIGLSALGWSSPLGIATILIMTFYVVDRVILKIYPSYFQRAFHTHSKLDGRMRTFIARRNITLPVFIIGYAVGFAPEAFYLIAAWQILTAVYHGVRTFWIVVVDRAHLDDRRPTDVAKELKKVD